MKTTSTSLFSRKASNKDIPLIEKVLLQKVNELHNKGIVQWQKGEVLWENLSKDFKAEDFYLVYQNNEIVGLFAVIDVDRQYWPRDLPHKALYIHKVCVLDKARGGEVSKFVLDEFKRLGREANLYSVKLDVRAHKHKLRAYYENNGFKLVRIEDLGFGYKSALYEFIL